MAARSQLARYGALDHESVIQPTQRLGVGFILSTILFYTGMDGRRHMIMHRMSYSPISTISQSVDAFPNKAPT